MLGIAEVADRVSRVGKRHFGDQGRVLELWDPEYDAFAACVSVIQSFPSRQCDWWLPAAWPILAQDTHRLAIPAGDEPGCGPIPRGVHEIEEEAGEPLLLLLTAPAEQLSREGRHELGESDPVAIGQ